MLPIHESYRHYRADKGVRKSVARLLKSLPPGHLAGLESVVLTNSRAVRKGRTGRVAGRKYKARECLGFYNPASSTSGPWIELIVDNIIPPEIPWYMRWSFLYDMLLSKTLFHEVGHHLDDTIGSPARNGEKAADKWADVLRARYFRTHHRLFLWILRMVTERFRAGRMTPALLLTLVFTMSAHAATWSYDVRETAPGRLAITARIPGGHLRIIPGMERYTSNVRVGSKQVARKGDHWIAPSCGELCLVQWDFDLNAAAAASRDLELARDLGDAIEAPPGTWLLRPEEEPDRVRLHVTAANGRRFVSGMPLAGDDFLSREFPRDVYSAFGRIEVVRIGAAELAIIRNGHALDSSLLRKWVTNAQRSIETYYGRFPVEHLLLLVRIGRGRGIDSGTAMGGGGAAIAIAAGDETPASDFESDWQLTHEMTHLTFPSVAREHHWIEEGIATYVEPIARVQAGLYSPAELWAELEEGLPKGLPQAGDRGLDHTHTWGRTYWGGALYCFLADVEIRKETANRFGLQDALGAIMRNGGTIDQEWELERTLTIGDTATGTHVLLNLYRAMADDPHPVDVTKILKTLDDATRHAIESPQK